MSKALRKLLVTTSFRVNRMHFSLSYEQVVMSEREAGFPTRIHRRATDVSYT